MKIFETTARAEGLDRLILDSPLSEQPSGRVRVIVQTDDDDQAMPFPPVDFMQALGSAYRDFPDMPRRTTAEWMNQLREGEEP